MRHGDQTDGLTRTLPMLSKSELRHLQSGIEATSLSK